MGVFDWISDAAKDVANVFKSGVNFVGNEVLKPGINFIGNEVAKPVIGTGLKIINTGVGVIGKGAEMGLDKAGQILDKGIGILERGADAGINTWEKMMGALTSPFGLVTIGVAGLALILLLKK